jgi:hypothetical protein
VVRLSPLLHYYFSKLDRYSFAVPEDVARKELRPIQVLKTMNEGLSDFPVPLLPRPQILLQKTPCHSDAGLGQPGSCHIPQVTIPKDMMALFVEKGTVGV